MNRIKSAGDVFLSYSTEREAERTTSSCPLSFEKGQRLLRKTLANHFDPKYWNLIREKGFFFCPTKDCPVYYFHNEEQIYLGESEVQTQVMHKMKIGNKDRPACYCKNVLEETILYEILVRKCCDSIIDIQNFTEANTGKDCAITNPTGRCCGKQIREILEWVKSTRLDVDIPVLNEAMTCCSKIDEFTDSTYDSQF